MINERRKRLEGLAARLAVYREFGPDAVRLQDAARWAFTAEIWSGKLIEKFYASSILNAIKAEGYSDG